MPTKRMLQQFQTQNTQGHNLKLYNLEAKGVRSSFFAAMVIRDWNNLANDTVHAKSINIFKAKLRHEWMNHTELYNYTFCCCCLPTPMALASGGSPMFPLVVHQPASPSIWPAVQSLRRGLSTNPGATVWCVCGCS